MKQMSIKTRVTLWYSLFLVAVVIFVLALILVAGRSAVISSSKNHLTAVVDDNMEELDFEHGELDLDDDFLFFTNGVSCLIYDETQTLVKGEIPVGFNPTIPFSDGALRQIDSGTDSYYVYDRLLALELGGSFWLRGITLAGTETTFLSMILQSSFLVLPLLASIAALGGYAITKQAFAPIEQITQATESINEGRDLSKRIPLGDNQDEIDQLAKMINQMLTRLEHSFESEKQFTSDASHELRTPLAIIKANCEYALNHPQTPASYVETLETIHRQSEKMHHLVSQLLAITRMEQGAATFELERTNVSELVQIICEEECNLPQKSITLVTDIEAAIFADIDRGMITRVLTNLIDNAYQYGRIDGTTKVTLQQQGGCLILTVEDNGIGIAKGDCAKVWNRFYQVNPARTNENGSMGLGLSIVKQMIQIHQGTIELKSFPEKGTSFIICLPIRSAIKK